MVFFYPFLFPHTFSLFFLSFSFSFSSPPTPSCCDQSIHGQALLPLLLPATSSFSSLFLSFFLSPFLLFFFSLPCRNNLWFLPQRSNFYNKPISSPISTATRDGWSVVKGIGLTPAREGWSVVEEAFVGGAPWARLVLLTFLCVFFSTMKKSLVEWQSLNVRTTRQSTVSFARLQCCF